MAVLMLLKSTRFYNLSRQVFIHTTLEKLIAKQAEEVRSIVCINMIHSRIVIGDSRCTSCIVHVIRKVKVPASNKSYYYFLMHLSGPES